MRVILGIFILFLTDGDGYRLVFDSHLRDDYQEFRDLPPMEAMFDSNYVSLPGFGLFEGCIDTSHECPNENVTFWFYTQATQDNPTQIDIDEPEFWKNIPTDRGKPWILIIHGYTGSRDSSPNVEIRPAYFQKGRYNIISVDYEPIVQAPCYISAVYNVPAVAKCTARMIDRLIKHGIFTLSELHVIGFSLGGQVAGHLKLFMRSGTIKRLTALDPALPLFITFNNEARVDYTDAEFVQVIHTNAGYKGQILSLGHVDFFPNGGYSQPGCSSTEEESMSSCNHARAPAYYAESINSDIGFWSIPCHSYITYYWGWCPANESNQILMGEPIPQELNPNLRIAFLSQPKILICGLWR